MFEFINTQTPLFELFIAALLGAFLGIRREIQAQNVKTQSFMGFRTMTLLSGMGAISTFFPNMPMLPMVFFGGLLIFLAIAYAHGSFKLNRIGLTTELSAILTFWIGVLVGSEQQTLAIFLTIFLAITNAFKQNLYSFVKTLNEKEWIGALQLLIFSGAILPFLPQEPIDPWGVFIPFNVWFLVILISGIGFVGYFLTKYFGMKGGIPLIGFLGAIVSSTAVTNSLADQSKKNKLTGIFAVGIMIALATMQIRVTIEILLLGQKDFILDFIMVPISMAISGIIMAIYYFYRTNKNHKKLQSEVKLESPFEIIPAMKFGAVFLLVLFALALGNKYFGEKGVYVAAFLSGLIDVDAIVLSTLESVRQGEIETSLAKNAIAIALFINTFIKIGYIALLGSKKLVKKVFFGITITTFVGLLALIFL